MSKFRSRIRDIGRAPGGLGFAAIARREKPRYVIVAAAVGNATEATAAVEAGADAVLFSDSVAPGVGVRVPVGVRIAAATRESVEAAREAGADFFVFDDGKTHATALTVDEVGAVLILDGDADEERLRMIAALDLDAILVRANVGALTVREQLGLRRIAGFGNAPILVEAHGHPDAACLEAWRDAGAPAVLVAAADVARTLEAAAQVPAPRRSSNERRLPSIGGTTTEAGHDHDEDDDD